MNARAMVAIGVAVAGIITATARAQGGTLARRVQQVQDGRVEFDFPARADACGDGAHWYRVGSDSWYGRTVESYDTSSPSSQCEQGPVRVMLTVVAREVVRIESFVGPRKHEEGATDLGAVDAREATGWLLSMARTLSGRPSRDAIGPTVLAKDGGAGDGLAAVARDEDRSRDTRRSAVSALLRLEASSGIASLLTLAEARNDEFLAGEAVRVLGRSGDPRARRHLRALVNDKERPEELRAIAVAGLGGTQATGEDAALLRNSLGTFTAERTRESVLSAVASVGGRTNAAWLLGIAKDEAYTTATRRRAVMLAERAGASGADLAAAYDAADDTATREAVISALATEGSRPAREKLGAIAKSTESPSLRRRAITALERFDSPETRELLTSLVVPRP
jgi:HEAT repeat protein